MADRTLWQRPPSGARWRRSLLLALPAVGACFPPALKTTPPGTYGAVGTDSSYTAPGTFLDTGRTTETDTTDLDTGTTDTGATDTGASGETGDTGHTYTGTPPGTTASSSSALGLLPKPTRPTRPTSAGSR
jgi:hypothetical protein